MRSTRDQLLETDFPDVERGAVSTLQVNLGYRCNQRCTHCHVNAGPHRPEQMSGELIEQVLQVLQARDIATLDLTGGAPEMNPHFAWLVEEARKLGVEVIDRCNLTILLEPGYEWLLPFLAEQQVTVVASLPCYSQDNVDAQRGPGVFDPSIEALQALNNIGYGHRLPLHLVYNPGGAFLPPPQGQLESDYKRELGKAFGIRFDDLYTLTNMPISRFGAMLLARGEFDNYMALLRENFSAGNLETLMCRHLVSADWQGFLYDCDFNQMLDLPMEDRGEELIAGRRALHLTDLLRRDLGARPVRTGEHCYGCAAGQGSSCGGALAEAG